MSSSPKPTAEDVEFTCANVYLAALLKTCPNSCPVCDRQLDLGGAFATFVDAALNCTLNPPFDPYADDLSFLLGAFIFEDVAVTWVQVGSRCANT